jgi:hypothetical protein
MTRNFDLSSIELKGRPKFLAAELSDYRARMRELGRTPTLRVKHADYVLLRNLVLRKTNLQPNELGDVLLDGLTILDSRE